ncbi:hypothetical protein CJ030_MR6G021353 [Morella rubra]|uniref:Uncharacterized protein n=1 Tax=Morella rubra TaxID=262757 RepID=A0A6A1VHV6_9ROSI|nr:hypothetical protein CJ030_MR6G021353 [Morella rubra]
MTCGITSAPESFERSKNSNGSASAAKVFVEVVEVTQPDLFNNGLVVVHGLQSFVSPFSPFSCDFDKMTLLSFPFHPNHTATHKMQPPFMRLMLGEAMLRLRSNGFSILALAMKVKYAELVGLTNTTASTKICRSQIRSLLIPRSFHFQAILENQGWEGGTPRTTMFDGLHLELFLVSSSSMLAQRFLVQDEHCSCDVGIGL